MRFEQQLRELQNQRRNLARDYERQAAGFTGFYPETRGGSRTMSAFNTRMMDPVSAEAMSEIRRMLEQEGKKPEYQYSGEEAVAVAVATEAKAKNDKVKKELEDTARAQEVEERTIKEKERRLENLKKKKSQLEETYKKLNDKDKNAFIEEYRSHITKLKMDDRIEKFEIDAAKRIVVTTNPLHIRKHYWRKDRIAGKYQIRIDFSKSSFYDAIQVLNITQRLEYYDSPTISDTDCCWGNMETDMDNDFRTHNLYEIVSDMIDYISSPNDNDGYLEDNDAGRDADGNYQKKGWERFIRLATPMPEGFCFEKKEQNERSRIVPGINVDGSGERAEPSPSLNIWDPMPMPSDNNESNGFGYFVSHIPQSNTQFGVYSSAGLVDGGRLNNGETMVANGSQQIVLNTQQQEFMRELEAMGLVPTSAYHMVGLIMPQSDMRPVYSVEIVERGSGFQMYVEREPRPVVPVTVSPDATPQERERAALLQIQRNHSAEQTGTSRFLLNSADLTQTLQTTIELEGVAIRVLQSTERNQVRSRGIEERRRVRQQAEALDAVAGRVQSNYEIAQEAELRRLEHQEESAPEERQWRQDFSDSRIRGLATTEPERELSATEALMERTLETTRRGRGRPRTMRIERNSGGSGSAGVGAGGGGVN